MMKICKIHGYTDHYVRKDSTGVRCRKCMSVSVQKNREKMARRAIEYKGGCCQVCGYNKCSRALEFHHLDPNTKEFGISKDGQTRGWTRVKKELDKCAILCANCHREVHAGLITLG